MSASLRAVAHRVARNRFGSSTASPDEARRLLMSCHEGLSAISEAHWEGRVTDRALQDGWNCFNAAIARVCSDLRHCEEQIWNLAGTFGRNVRKIDQDKGQERKSWP